MPMLRIFWATAALAIAANSLIAADRARALGLTCPTATEQCLEKWGYNYQACGELAGQAGRPQRFPTCYDTEGDMCAPCWFDGVQDTVAACQQSFGDRCRFFALQNRTWSDAERIPGAVESGILDPLTSWFRDDIGGN